MTYLNESEHKHTKMDTTDHSTTGDTKTTIKEVGVALRLKILKVNDVEEEFTVELTIHTIYRDCDSVVPDKTSFDVFERSVGFTGFIPDIQVKESVRLKSFKNVIVTNINRYSGLVWTQLKNTATVKQFWQLQSFPFDRQDCWIVVEGLNARLKPWDQDRNLLLPVPSPDLHDGWFTKVDTSVIHRVWLAPKGWSVRAARGIHYEQNLSYAGLNTVGVVAFLERDPWFYGFNYSLVIFFIVGANVANLAASTELVSGRISSTTSLLLTLVTFRNGMMSGVPTLNYLTYMDRYVVLGFCFIIAGVIESSAVSRVENADVAHSIDLVFHLTYLSLWVFIHLLLLLCLNYPTLLRPSWRHSLCDTYREYGRTLRVAEAGYDISDNPYLGMEDKEEEEMKMKMKKEK